MSSPEEAPEVSADQLSQSDQVCEKVPADVEELFAVFRAKREEAKSAYKQLLVEKAMS